MSRTSRRYLPAPELQVSEWLNTKQPLSLEDCRGRTLVIEAFQMLCPGCVSHGLPQAQRIRQCFPENEVAVIGLHTVFEHHEAQGSREALSAFLHEYRIDFPVGIDARDASERLPKTMSSLNLRGTPSLLMIDGRGRICYHQFGRPDDMAVGAAVMSLVVENRSQALIATSAEAGSGNAAGCTEDGCAVPR